MKLLEYFPELGFATVIDGIVTFVFFLICLNVREIRGRLRYFLHQSFRSGVVRFSRMETQSGRMSFHLELEQQHRKHMI